MSATMARQGGRVQLEQSDMHLALNMAIMAKDGVSRAAMEETKYLIKKPRAEVRAQQTKSVEFPGHKKVQAAIKRHPAMLRQDQTSGCLPCQNDTPKNQQARWRHKGTGEPASAQTREWTPEPTSPPPGRHPPQPVTRPERNLSKSSIRWPDIGICIQLFPTRNISMMIRIPSTIPILIQIC